MLPLCAAVFWLGLLLGDGVTPALGAGLLLVVLAASARAAISARGRVLRSRQLLEAAGFREEEPPEPDFRERLLAAAGFQEQAEERPAEIWRRWVVIAVCALLAGIGWSALRLHETPLGPIEDRYLAFRATAASDIQRYDWGWGLEANVGSVSLDGRIWPLDLKVQVSGSEEGVTVEAGELVRGEGRVEALDDSGFGRYLASRGIDATVRASSLDVREGSEALPLAAANASRRALRTGLDRALSGRAEGLLLGLAIGDTSRLDPETEEDFRASGLSHLLAVSGSNVATFLAPVLLLAARFRARPRVRSLIAAAAVVFFALLTRWEPSVLRASAMAAIALIALASGRPRSIGPALGVAVLLLLVVDPGLVGSVGFELSVAATAGIALMAGPIAARLRVFPKPLALAVAATLSAQMAVTPLLLLRFGVVPVVTLLANVLAFPAVTPALALGIPSALIALPLPAVGRLVGRVAEVPNDYLIAVADRTARFPLPSLTARGSLVPLITAVLVGLAVWRLRRGRRPVAILVVAVVVAAASWAVPLAATRPELTVTFLDVGQGDSALVRSPAGATILVDAGPEEDLVAAELARLGVRRIDMAVATHPHADHVAGFPAVLARFPISLLLDPGCPGDSPVYERFLDAVTDEEVSVENPRGGDRFTVGDLYVEVLGPDGCSPLGEPNDDSIVLRISRGDDSILFTGDAEVPAQQDMIEDADPLAADVLKVPHHGGDTSDAEFLESTGAAVAVISVGTNTYGHPNPALLEILEAAGMNVYRTDLLGELVLRFTENGAVAVGSSA